MLRKAATGAEFVVSFSLILPAFDASGARATQPAPNLRGAVQPMERPVSSRSHQGEKKEGSHLKLVVSEVFEPGTLLRLLPWLVLCVPTTANGAWLGFSDPWNPEISELQSIIGTNAGPTSAWLISSDRSVDLSEGKASRRRHRKAILPRISRVAIYGSPQGQIEVADRIPHQG
jgi:hypothetical protein